MTFENFSHALNLRTLTFSYIQGLEGNAHPASPEILISTYGMKLKLGPVIALDERRRWMTPSVWSPIKNHS